MKESYDEMINQTQHEKNERSTNAIHYYINDDSCPTQRDVCYIFGITEQKFRRDWSKFKTENNLISTGQYVTFRDTPKYPCLS